MDKHVFSEKNILYFTINPEIMNKIRILATLSVDDFYIPPTNCQLGEANVTLPTGYAT